MAVGLQIEISGKIAEIIDDEAGRYVRIVCKSSNMLIELDNLDDISLGDTITIKGNLAMKHVIVNGIEQITNNQ